MITRNFSTKAKNTKLQTSEMDDSANHLLLNSYGHTTINENSHFRLQAVRHKSTYPKAQLPISIVLGSGGEEMLYLPLLSLGAELKINIKLKK